MCVFLAGGNDGNNLIVPTSTAEYAAYAAVRSASGLAIARDSLLPVAPTGINTPFGLHPSLVELHALWAQQKVAVVCNEVIHPLSGSLLRPSLIVMRPKSPNPASIGITSTPITPAGIVSTAGR